MPQAISRLSQSEVLMSFRRSARAKSCKTWNQFNYFMKLYKPNRFCELIRN
jgi:hypothetical protein